MRPMILDTLAIVFVLGVAIKCLVVGQGGNMAQNPAAEGIGAALKPSDFRSELPKGKKWKLIWHDEFDGHKLDESKWSVRGPYRAFGGQVLREAVFLDDNGYLLIGAYEKDGEYYGGMIDTKGKFEHRYGYWVARCKLPKEQGHFPAFWIWAPLLGGEEAVKAGKGLECGTEIDVFEWVATTPDLVHHTIHWIAGGKRHSRNKVVKVPEVSKGFHTFAVEWTPKEYIFYVDGKETWRTTEAVSQISQFACLSTHIGPPGEWAGDIRKADLPDFFVVDWVRVYEGEAKQ